MFAWRNLWAILVVEAILSVWSHPAVAQRTTVSLDGTWRIAESVAADEMPAQFEHAVAVPGLVHDAKPAFPLVDQYETWEYLWDCGILAVLSEADHRPGGV